MSTVQPFVGSAMHKWATTPASWTRDAVAQLPLAGGMDVLFPTADFTKVSVRGAAKAAEAASAASPIKQYYGSFAAEGAAYIAPAFVKVGHNTVPMTIDATRLIPTHFVTDLPALRGLHGEFAIPRRSV